jgi:hypothetical protein
MTRLSCLVVSMLFLIAVGCTPISVRSDYDLNADFSKYRTYSYVPKTTQKPGPQPQARESFLDQRLMTAIDRSLKAKGYRMKEQEPDFLVAYQVNLENRLEVYQYNYSYRYWGPTSSYVQEYKEATLTLDFVDPKTNQMFWRGWAAKDVYDLPRNPEEAQENINRAVDKILENYPPR